MLDFQRKISSNMIVNTLRAKSRKIIIGLQVQGQQRKVEERKHTKENGKNKKENNVMTRTLNKVASISPCGGLRKGPQ